MTEAAVYDTYIMQTRYYNKKIHLTFMQQENTKKYDGGVKFFLPQS